jgi:hypothetical protein
MITEDKKEIEGFDEAMSYFFIDAIGGFIWRTNHDIGHGRYEMTPEMQKNLTEMFEKQQYCVKQLSKFGVDPESTTDRTNGEYWKWFRHWDSWKQNMTDDEWYVFDQRMSKKEDMTDYLPKTKWNEK